MKACACRNVWRFNAIFFCLYLAACSCTIFSKLLPLSMNISLECPSLVVHPSAFDFSPMNGLTSKCLALPDCLSISQILELISYCHRNHKKSHFHVPRQSFHVWHLVISSSRCAVCLPNTPGSNISLSGGLEMRCAHIQEQVSVGLLYSLKVYRG